MFQTFAPSCQREEGEDGGHHHNGVNLGVAFEDEAAEVKGEHAGDESPGQTEVLNAEEHPNDTHGKESEDDGRHRTDFLHHLAEEELVGADEQAVQGTPNDEVPRGTVPQAAEQEAEPEVEVHTTCAFAVAAERNIEVVHDESTEGLVPTPPELGDRARSVRVVEIFREFEAHDATQTDGHVAVAGKVEIDLEGVGQGDEPCRTRVQSGDACHDVAYLRGVEGGRPQHLVNAKTDDISDEDFLTQTDDKTIETLQAVGHRGFALTDLLGNVAIAHDGTCNELREHGDIQHVIAQFLQGLVDATVGVQSVGDALEREERDTDGQQDALPS